MSPPANCPSCLAWRRAQTDEDIACAACTHAWRIPKGVKIMFHRNEGVWALPSHCRRCEGDPDRRRREDERQRDARHQTSRSAEPLRTGSQEGTGLAVALLAKGIAATNLNPVALSRSLDTYNNQMTFDNHGNRETVLQHVQRHFDGIADAFGTDSPQRIIDIIADISLNTNQEQVYEFNEGDRTIIKVDVASGVMIAIPTFARRQDGVSMMLPRTALRKSTSSIKKKVVDGTWVAA